MVLLFEWSNLNLYALIVIMPLNHCMGLLLRINYAGSNVFFYLFYYLMED